MGRRLKSFFLGVKEWLKGKPEVVQHIQKMNPKQFKTQQAVLDYIDNIVKEGPKKIEVAEIPKTEELMPGGFPQIQQPTFRNLPDIDVDAMKSQAIREFETQGLPSLAERFSSLGKGAIASSGFAATAGRARADLASNLAALGERMKSQYNLERAGMETRQQGLGLEAQRLGAATQFQAGDFRLRQALAQLHRAGVQKSVQPNLGVLAGIGMQQSFEPIIRPATAGSLETGAGVAGNLFKLYMGMGL